MRAPRLLCLLLVAACGLVPPDPIGFRSYVLQGTSYGDAASIVNDVTRRFALEHWGGVNISWIPEDRNLVIGPIAEPQRRMQLYIHLEPAGADVNVEMFALVQTLQADAGRVGWGDDKQDVPLEEMLYQSYVAELVARQGAAH